MLRVSKPQHAQSLGDYLWGWLLAELRHRHWNFLIWVTIVSNYPSSSLTFFKVSCPFFSFSLVLKVDLVNNQLGVTVDDQVPSRKFFLQARSSEQYFIFHLIIGSFKVESKGTAQLDTLRANQNYFALNLDYVDDPSTNKVHYTTRAGGGSLLDNRLFDLYVNLVTKSVSTCP